MALSTGRILDLAALNHRHGFTDYAEAFEELAASRQGAPRQAEDEVVSTSHDLVDDRIRDAGVAVRVGSFVPGGAAVRLDVGDLSRWLQPDEAHELSLVLEKAAIAALHEDRAMRHAAAAARTGFGQEKKR